MKKNFNLSLLFFEFFVNDLQLTSLRIFIEILALCNNGTTVIMNYAVEMCENGYELWYLFVFAYDLIGMTTK